MLQNKTLIINVLFAILSGRLTGRSWPEVYRKDMNTGPDDKLHD